MEPENVKEALKTLLGYNRVGSNPRVKDGNGEWRNARAEDLQEFNN